MDRIALIPAYEPGEELITLTDDLASHGFRVVVVDDGSGPDYQHIFNRLDNSENVITYEENHGKGYALKLGLNYIYSVNEGQELTVVTVDSDGQHLTSDIIKVCDQLEQDSTVDLILGSRRQTKNSPIKSRLGNGITRMVFRLATGLNIYDTQTGLRAFHTGLIPTLLQIPGDRYEYEMNVLLQLARTRQHIVETPIQTVYFDKKNSISHFNAWSDSFRIYREIIRFAGCSFASFLVDYGIYSIILATLGTSEVILVGANFGARAVSSILNFCLNKRLVFRTRGDVLREAAGYFGLVIFNICINSLLLTLLTHLGINAYIGKLIAELSLFIISYTVQHFIIFTGRGRRTGTCIADITRP